MKKLLIFSALMLLVITGVRAEVSSPIGDGTYRSMQTFVTVYNNCGQEISSNYIVCIDVTASDADVTAFPRRDAQWGGYATLPEATASIFTLGVADEDIATGKLGRVCVRGPHMVKVKTNAGVGSANLGSYPTWGDWVVSGISQVLDAHVAGDLGNIGFGHRASANFIKFGNATQSATLGVAVGMRIGDSTHPASSTTDDLIWIWVDRQVIYYDPAY